MARLDVKSLFTSVPVNFTIDLILNNIFKNGVKHFNGLNRQQMKKLLTWTCKETVFQFGGNIYKQTEGMAMGSPIAPLMADVCINWVLNEVSSFQGRTQGGGVQTSPIGMSTKMHNKENITFLALLSLLFCNDMDSNMI